MFDLSLKLLSQTVFLPRISRDGRVREDPNGGAEFATQVMNIRHAYKENHITNTGAVSCRSGHRIDV